MYVKFHKYVMEINLTSEFHHFWLEVHTKYVLDYDV